MEPMGSPSTWNFAPYDWLALQALGTPNTFVYGDAGTAWAPEFEDADPEFGAYATLSVGFGTADYATGLLVRQTSGNGFVYQIDLLDSTDVWYNAVWTGTDRSVSGAPVNFVATWTQTAYLVKGARITIALGDAEDDEWEQIDAVRLLNATANSTPGTAPVAANDSFSVAENGSQIFDVQAAITNAEGYPLILAIATAPTYGTAEIDFNGTPDDPSDDTIVYTPDPDYYGSDSFEYSITDIWGRTDTGTVTITVTSVNNAPTLESDRIFASAVKNTPLAIDLAALTQDVE
ncbi:MAG: cadherin-like domain-containing protein, partial [Nitrospiraceae bacterium]|nr:cadherin-like domain-containing protein [Nitrospiraceae bacterium]